MISQETTILKSIWNFLFGYKYYACIINTRGVIRTELSSFIFRTKEEAEAYRRSLETNVTYIWIETVSFRSRRGWFKKAESLYRLD